MKLGIGFYKHMLTRDNFRFARQAGCSHLIIHLAEYYSKEKGVVTATDERLGWFLREILPVAEEAGVEMALHPDDPPMPRLRNTPRLVYQPSLYQKLIDMDPSRANKLEFCMGSIQEMSEGNIYDSIDHYASQGKISYAHLRNVIGKVPGLCAWIHEGGYENC